MQSSDELKQKLEGLRKLNRLRFDYVLERAKNTSIKSACENINRTQSWYYSFTPEERQELEELAIDLHYSQVTQAFLTLQGVSGRAAGVMADDLEARDKKLRQSAAKDILDRTGVKEPDRKEIDVTATVNITGLGEMLARAYGKDGDEG